MARDFCPAFLGMAGVISCLMVLVNSRFVRDHVTAEACLIFDDII